MALDLTDVRRIRVLLCLGLALVTTGCPFDDADDPGAQGDSSGAAEQTTEELVCGRTVLPSPAVVAGDPCTSGELVFADTFERTTGRPNTFSHTINIPRDGRACVTVVNGGFDTPSTSEKNKSRRVSAGWVEIDGELVAGPDQFGQDVTQYRTFEQVEKGEHQVDVRLASRPTSSVSVEVRLSQTGASHARTMGENGILEVSNVLVDHPMFSPNGDGFHDDALFNADNFAHALPGEETGQYDYAVEWEWQLVDADSCDPVAVVLSGTEPVNSPAYVQAYWDGTLTDGTVIDDGTYIYEYHAELVRSDGLVIDTAVADAHALVVDSSEPSFDASLSAQTCNPDEDPDACQCPGGDLGENTRCTFAWMSDLTSFEEPSRVDTDAFIEARYDQGTGRWQVVVDLREYNGGGLVPQGPGTWTSIEELQDYVSALTGVPADGSQTRLFNFDYVQLGYSTPVGPDGVVDGFNHFLVDVITDANGHITIGDRTLDLERAFASDTTPLPQDFRVDQPRQGDACAYNGNSDGRTKVSAKSCTRMRSANLDADGTGLGIYSIQKTMFDLEIDEKGTLREQHCVSGQTDGPCGVRTIQRDGAVRVKAEQFSEDGGLHYLDTAHDAAEGVPSVVIETDRLFELNDPETTTIDGACVRSLFSHGALSIPLDSAAGAVPSVCIINGII